MKELLQTYNISEIILFIFLILIAAKEVIELYRYFKGMIKGGVKKEDYYEDKINEVIEKVDTLSERYDKTLIEMKNIQDEYNNHFEEQGKSLTILLESDRDDIKGYIVEKHHQFTQQGWIDDFSMDVLTRRFKHYKDEGGNSYAERLMKELDQLPKQPPQN